MSNADGCPLISGTDNIVQISQRFKGGAQNEQKLFTKKLVTEAAPMTSLFQTSFFTTTNTRLLISAII